MSLKDNAIEGAWGIGALLVPALLVNTLTGNTNPGAVLLGTLAATAVGSFYGFRESRKDLVLRAIERETVLLEQHRRIDLLSDRYTRAATEVIGATVENYRLKVKLVVAGKKIQRLTERFVHGE